MKTINLDLKERKDNCIFAYHNYKKNRKCDANCYATALLIRNADTLECIKFFVKMVSDNYPDKEFMIEHDGIITFNVKCDNKIIYTGTHYDVEEMFKEGTYVFRDELINRIK